MWSDALHYGWLSGREVDRWDVGAYVRSVIVNSCIVIEAYLANVSGCKDVGYSIKRNLNDHISITNGSTVNWGTGWAQTLLAILEMRKNIIHKVSNLREAELKPNSNDANAALNMSKFILDGIHSHWKQSDDRWWHCDQYEDYKKESCFGFICLKKNGYNQEDGIELFYKWKDKEYVHFMLPGNEQWEVYWAKMMSELRGPISYIAVRKNGKILREMNCISRGV